MVHMCLAVCSHCGTVFPVFLLIFAQSIESVRLGSWMTIYMQNTHWSIPWKALGHCLGDSYRHSHCPAEIQLAGSFPPGSWASAERWFAGVQSTNLTTRWQPFPSWVLLQPSFPSSVSFWIQLLSLSAISGKRFFTKETFIGENSRIKCSETEELEEENTISPNHVLTQPSFSSGEVTTVLCPFAPGLN